MVNARNWTFAASWMLLAGCAVHMHGLVDASGPGTTLKTPDGKEWRLVAVAEAAPVNRLDGHLVTVDGRRVLKTVTVEDWKVPEGLHGMTAWVGELRWMGARLAVQDRNSDQVFFLDPGAVETLRGHVDQVVLVEGYVDGPQTVEVLYFRVLE